MFSSKALPPTFASALGIMMNPWFFGAWMSLALGSYWYFDEAIAFYFRDHLSQPELGILKQISKLGIGGYYIAAMLGLYAIARYVFKHPYFTKVFALLAASLIIPGVFCDILKMIFGRYRPRMLFGHDLYGFHFFTLESKMWSFPSGHSVTIMSLMVALSFLLPKRWAWLCLFGVFICATRILITAHFLSDVMVGAYIGVLGAYFCYAWLERAEFVTNLNMN